MRYPFRSGITALITAIGRRFHIDAHYFAKNSFWVLLSQAVGFLRGLVSGYLVARFFDQEVYGEYQFILSVLGVLAVFGLPGMVTPVARAWSRKQAFSIDAITRHQLVVSSVASLALLAAIPLLGRFGKDELWPLFLAAAVLFPLAPVAAVRFGAYTVGNARFDVALRANIVCSALAIVMTGYIILFNQSALLMLVTAVAIPPLVYLWMSRGFRPPEDTGAGETDEIVHFAWKLTFASLPADLAWYLDKIMISHYFGLNELALFSVSLIIPEQAKVFTKQFFPIAFAKQAAAVDSSATRAKLTWAVLSGTAVFAVGIAAYIVLCPFVMPYLFPQYDQARLVLLTSVAAAIVITNPATLFAQYLEAQGMIRETRIAQWSAAALFALSLVAFIPAFGLLGAMVARGVFRLTLSGVSCWFVWRAPFRAA